jgi:hypothetical protein
MSDNSKWILLWPLVWAVISYYVALQLAQSTEVVQMMSSNHVNYSVDGKTSLGVIGYYQHEFQEAFIWFSLLFIARTFFDRAVPSTSRKLLFVVLVAILLAVVTDIKLEEEKEGVPDHQECYMYTGILFMTFGILPVAPYLLPLPPKRKRR